MKRIAFDTVRLQEVEILGPVTEDVPEFGLALVRVKPTRPNENAEYEQWVQQLVERSREYKPGEVIRDFDGCTVRIASPIGPGFPFSLMILDEDRDKIGFRNRQVRPLIEALEEYAEVKGL